MAQARMITVAALALTTAAMPFITARSSAAAAPRQAGLQAEADAILDAAYDRDGPGAAAIITRDGKLVYARGRGVADLAAHKAITPDTVFKLGSIAKQFTAAVILQLVDEGRIGLDDPLSRFFPDWPQPGARATVRQLLNHTSGLRDFSKVPGWIANNRDRRFTTAELVTLTRSLGSKASPGNEWEYNNGGYVVLGAIVEKTTGKPWYTAVEQRIARPLGLRSLRYAASAEGSPDLARGYGIDHGKVEPRGTADMSIAGAAGGLVASVRDMAKWAEALHTGKVVKPALYKEMTTPARLADGSTAPYGFALRLRSLLGHPALEHGGAGRGIDTASAYLPADRLFVAVFSNSDNLPTDSSVVLRRLGAVALGTPWPTFTRAAVDPASVQPLFGRYGVDGTPEIRFFFRDGGYVIASGNDEHPLLPAGNDRFFSANGGLTWVSFVREPGGATVELHEPDSAAPERHPRRGDLIPDAEVEVPMTVLQSYVGEYQTEVLAVTVAVGRDGRLTMQPKGQDALPMRPISNTEFKLDGNKMSVVFNPVGGKVDSFTLHRGARELHGKRIVK